MNRPFPKFKDDAALGLENRLLPPAVGCRYRHARQRTPGTALSPKTSLQSYRLNLVVTCKGRLRYLKRTLPLFVAQLSSIEGRVIVVDYGDPDGSFEYCQQIAHPKLAAMRVLDNTDQFNLSRARNCGANLLPCDIIGFVDADSLVHPHLAEQGTYMIRAGRAVLTRRDFRDWQSNTFGLCFVRVDAYHRTRGYDEAFEGWGLEDADFYRRTQRVGPVLPFPTWLYPTALPHSNYERTQFNVVKDIFKSADRSSRLFAKPEREVNPGGYGRTKASVFIAGTVDGPQQWDVSNPYAQVCPAHLELSATTCAGT